MTAREITSAIGPLLQQLGMMGIKISGSRYDANSFGNFYVDCRGAKGSFRIVRDRSQYFLDSDVADIKKHGLFKAYDSVQEFTDAALKYAKAFA